MSEKDDDISRGYDAGNYAAAYETDDLDAALAGLESDATPEYRAAFTLGFFSSCELHEMSDPDAYHDAYALVAPRAIELGIAVERDEQDYDDHNNGEAAW